MAVRYREVADDLRSRIVSGEYPPGSRLPTYVELAERYSVSKDTIREALSLLQVDGLVRAVKKSGILVREQVGRDPLDRGGVMWRNELGYIGNRSAGHWKPLSVPVREWRQASADVAEFLDVEPGAPVLVRDRVIGLPDDPLQLATTYLPEWVARGTVLEEADTGPGGIYDRLEQDLGHGPLTWEETISTRLPAPVEARALKVSDRTPLLRFARVAISVDGRPVELNDTRVSGDRFHIVREIARDSETAVWPVAPATGRNQPQSRP